MKTADNSSLIVREMSFQGTEDTFTSYLQRDFYSHAVLE